jgi:hypothetical protein
MVGGFVKKADRFFGTLSRHRPRFYRLNLPGYVRSSEIERFLKNPTQIIAIISDTGNLNCKPAKQQQL